MKVIEILKYYEILKGIIDNKDLNITAMAKFKLLGIMKQLEGTVVNFNNVRNDVIMKYGWKNENGDIGIFQDDDRYSSAIEKVNSELTNIIESEVDYEIRKLKADDVIDSGIPAEILVQLYDLIQE